MLPYYLLPVPLGLLAVVIYTVWDWQRHRAPIVAENPENHYTLLHHLKVVTLPVFKYRISFVVSRSDKAEVRQLATKFPVSAASQAPAGQTTPAAQATQPMAPPHAGVAATPAPVQAAAAAKPMPAPTYDYAEDS